MALALTRPMIGLFRIAAAMLIIAGIAVNIAENYVDSLFLYFTVQSNILGIIVLLFGAVCALTGGKVSACPKLSFVATMALLVTFIIFWTLLAPLVTDILWTFYNLMEHLFAPMLVVIDRLMFYKGCAPSPRGAMIALVYPVYYVIQAMVVGLGHLAHFDIGWFPYPFLDVDVYGAWVILNVILVALGIALLASLWAHMERRRDKRLVLKALAP